MKKLDIKKMEKMEYWVGNSFIENLKYEIISQVESDLSLLEEIKKDGSKLDLSGEQKKAYIADNLEDCFEYIQNSNNNDHDIKLDVDEIISFVAESIAEAMEEFIENNYKNEWELLKVIYLDNLLIGQIEKKEDIEMLLKTEFTEMVKYKSYPIWAVPHEVIRCDYNKRSENYIELNPDWYADKRDFKIVQ